MVSASTHPHGRRTSGNYFKKVAVGDDGTTIWYRLSLGCTKLMSCNRSDSRSVPVIVYVGPERACFKLDKTMFNDHMRGMKAAFRRIGEDTYILPNLVQKGLILLLLGYVHCTLSQPFPRFHTSPLSRSFY